MQNWNDEFARLGESLTRLKWDFVPALEPLTYESVFPARTGEVWVYVNLRPLPRVLLCYGVVPMATPKELEAPVLELVARLNSGLPLGNVEYDFGSGEVRFKSSVCYRGHELTPAVVENALLPAAYTMGRFLPALHGVLTQGMAPAEAVTTVGQRDDFRPTTVPRTGDTDGT